MDEQKPETFTSISYKEENNSAEYIEGPPDLAPPPSIPRYLGPPKANIIRNSPTIVGLKRRNPDLSDYYSQYTSVERYNEEVAMRFLIGNGQPLTKINDDHFRAFLHHLNPSRAPPESGNMTTKAMHEKRPALEYQRNIGPLNVTIEAIGKFDEVLMSISTHHYDALGESINTVHFEKIILADYVGEVVADRLRRVIDAKKSLHFGITNIVSPNIRMMNSVAEHMHFKNRFICFFTYLTNIARGVIEIPEFTNGLKLLREYVTALQKHPEVYTKFKKMQLEASIVGIDVPTVDINMDWLSTLQFLSNCSFLNQIFANLHENWCMPKYLNPTQENAMANLLDFLLVLCKVSKEVCSEDSCVSQVLYCMSLINKAIENCRITSAKEEMRKIFHKFYSSISNGKIGEFYSISSLLDPRFGYSDEIFNNEDWQCVEKKLIKEMNDDKQQEKELRIEMRNYRELLDSRPAFDEISTPCRWWNALQEELPIMHQKWVEYSGTPAVSIDGKRFFSKGGKFAHLFATLDEELHEKAILLAQSSQDFVGRGSSSRLILSQMRNGQSTFRRLTSEKEKKEESEHVEEEEPTEKEPHERALTVSDNSEEQVQEVKEELPNNVP